MLAAGIDIIPDKKNNLGAKREKRGECPTCGIPTHKTAMFGKPKPLTVEGQVYKGRCLVCHPLEGYIRRPPGGGNIINSQAHHRQYGGGGQHPQQQSPQQQTRRSLHVPPSVQEPQHLERQQTHPQATRNSYCHPPLTQQQMQQHQQQQQQLLAEAQLPPQAESGARIPHTLGVNFMDDDVSVITMDYRLEQAARNWTPGIDGEVAEASDEETDLIPPVPLPGRRPGPDAGDSHANDGTADFRGGGPPLRSGPSYGGGMAVPPGNSGMDVGGPHNRPSVPVGAAGMGGSYRRNQVPVPSLPTTQEHAPERSYRQLISEEETGYNAEDYGGSNGPALDADGYPIATSDYGWDKQADLLPPGGMDMLLRNRSGEVRMSVTSNRRHSSATNGEIRFQPLIEEPAGESLDDAVEFTTQQPPLDTWQQTGYQSFGAAAMQERKIAIPQRLESMESGPMFLPDDVPAYMDDAAGSPAMTRLEAHRSEPIRGVVRQVAAGAAGDGTPDLPRGLRTRKSTGSGNRPSRQTFSDGSDYGFNGVPGAKFESKHSIETGSHGASTMASTFAPPLVSRDLRGRPDDDMIQDPAMSVRSQFLVGTKPAMGALLDDQEDDTPVGSPVSKPAGRTVSGEGRASLKAPPAQYLPELSPTVPKHRVIAKSEILEPRGPMERQESPGLMYIMEETKGLSIPLSTSVQNQTSSRLPVDGISKEAPSNQKVAPPEDSDERAYNDHDVTGVSPSSERVSAMLRKLSITPEQEKAEEMRQRGPQPVKGSQQTMDDIPVIVHCLNLNQANANMREKALRSLAAILWTSGEKGRDFVLQFKGVETLVKTMWDDMSNEQVQDAAAEFLLSLAASLDAQPQSDLLANEDTFCDSLLFAMQTHSNIPGIQLKGCAIFSCLAAASSNNSTVSDGSLSGALMMVLSAMSNHGRSEEIQKAGLQALFNQCTLSANAESNKRSLVESRLDNGAPGMDVILNSMRSLQHDLVAMEWACKLCWSLTSSEDLVNSISRVPAMMQEIIQICQRNITDKESVEILEACFGVIGNMAHVDSNRMELLQQDAVTTLTEGMLYQPGYFSLNLEACSAIANLAVSNPIREAFIKAGALDSVLRVLQTYIDYDEFVGEAMRALVCLAMHSQENKEAMAVPDVLGLIIAVSSKHEESHLVQEMCCKLLATLAVGRATTEVIIQNGGMDLLVRALNSNSNEKVLEAACSAYRNFACQVQDADSLSQEGALTSTINVMARHENSLSIQTNSCCAIWNIAFKTNKEPGALVGNQGVQVIVKAMQTHMESSDLLELACGALWSIIDESIERKKDVVGSGAIDAVVCTMVMHPTTPSTLINACGVFSNLGAEGPLAEAVANAQGVSVVSDAMRNNGSAIDFLEIGCLTLRNIVFQFPEFAQEASMAISPIIDAMRDNITATSFQQAACNLLWVLAAEAESCRSKILALDGISVLMQCLEQNSYDPKVQEAALGAFNQLAVNGNQ
jgi:hypothetical protein